MHSHSQPIPQDSELPVVMLHNASPVEDEAMPLQVLDPPLPETSLGPWHSSRFSPPPANDDQNPAHSPKRKRPEEAAVQDKSLTSSSSLISLETHTQSAPVKKQGQRRGRSGQSLVAKLESHGEKNFTIEFSSERLLRRSPRLSSGGLFGTSGSSSKPTVYNISSKILKSCGKQGPASRTSESEVKPLFLSWEDYGESKPSSATCNGLEVSFHKNNLRKSPRFVSRNGSNISSMSLEKVSKNHLRRSPRFVSENGSNAGPESLERVSKSHLRRTTRRHVTVNGCDFSGKSLECATPRLLVKAKAETSPSQVHSLLVKVNSGSGISFDSLDEQPSKRAKSVLENYDSEFFEEKFSTQSARASNSVSEAENGKVNPNELLKSAKKHTLQRNSREEHPPGKIFPKEQQKEYKCTSSLIGDPVPDAEAQKRWLWRYEMKSQKLKCKRITVDDEDDEDKIVWNVECHYTQAEIDGCIISLGDCVYVKGEGAQNHVGKIVEFFKTTNGEEYFRVQWFYRAEDTVIKDAAVIHDKRRLFYSTVMNDNPLDCIISKVSVIQLPPRMNMKKHSIPPSDFYFDMEYCVDYSTFRNMLTDNIFKEHESSSPDSSATLSVTSINTSSKNMPSCERYKAKLLLLDLFSGCGGMSTGLCLGAKASCIDLETKWALDFDQSACESIKLNKPEAHVRNEAAEDFLELLKEWEKLCKRYAVNDAQRTRQSRATPSRLAKETKKSDNDDANSPGEFEVSKIVDICYGDINDKGKRGLKLKVHWKGYSTSEDTWEPIEGLSNCQECIGEFIRQGFRSKILPLPGDVDVICGGPPCQGISGYNRFRNVDSPLDDDRNRQIIVFMDIVQFLKPKFVLMENVVDILRFDKASLARYALSRLVNMKYQARLGTIAAGCYGLPQFRLRVFLWGAHPNEKLPQFPLPTHDVIVRYWPPPEFERNTVAYDEGVPRELEKAIVLQDAISDLPAVTSRETREEMAYERPPETEFQQYIRSPSYEMTGHALSITTRNNFLYDHRPYSLSEDDYARVCQIPKRKGANFRDLPGIIVGTDNVARRDPKDEQMLPSGKPLAPDFAFTFEQGKSKRPYARLWWDETVSTVVTFPDLHSQAILHPEQDRVLTIRECARLQGFPDYFKFCGTVKQRYRQIGNAVAVPVGRALGYSLGLAFQKLSDDEHLMKLPPKFSLTTNLQLAKSSMFPETG